MKTARFLPILAGVLTLAFSLGTAEAKKKPAGFSEFRGNYTGQPSTIIYGGSPYPATANISISVPKNGTTAVITVSGLLSGGGSQYPISNTFTLTKTSIGVADVSYKIQSGSPSAAGSGQLNGRGTTFVYTAFVTGSPDIPITGTISVKPKGKKNKELSISMQFTTGGSTYSFPFTGIAKASKK